MVVSRASILEANFRTLVSQRTPIPGRTDLEAPVRPGTSLTARTCIEIFLAQCESRICDFLSRELKARGESFYTIASSGHEGNAAVGQAIGLGDISFLHYRSGAYFLARANRSPGTEGAFDVLLGMVASRDEPIAGGRHKVFGSVPLNIPPQTSTIASHLPKALGCAVSLDRRARLENRDEERIARSEMPRPTTPPLQGRSMPPRGQVSSTSRLRCSSYVKTMAWGSQCARLQTGSPPTIRTGPA